MTDSPYLYAPEFTEKAVELILESGRRAIERNGKFQLGLAGGSTPVPVYQLLAEKASARNGGVPEAENFASQTFFTFGDERCVPPESKESNYRMARETLFDPANIKPSQVLRMKGELEPHDAAVDYEKNLAERCIHDPEHIYRHDLLLLGLGEDGHTASLFPGTDAVGEERRMVVANRVPKLESWRLTLSFPVINAAREILFLVSGERKRLILEEILTGGSTLPAARVQPYSGRLTYLTDFEL